MKTKTNEPQEGSLSSDVVKKKVAGMFYRQKGKSLSAGEMSKIQTLCQQHEPEEVLEAARSYLSTAADADVNTVADFSKNYGSYALGKNAPQGINNGYSAPNTKNSLTIAPAPPVPQEEDILEQKVIAEWIAIQKKLGNTISLSSPPMFLKECLRNPLFRENWESKRYATRKVRGIIWKAAMIFEYRDKSRWCDLRWICKKDADGEWGWEKVMNGKFDDFDIPSTECGMGPKGTDYDDRKELSV